MTCKLCGGELTPDDFDDNGVPDEICTPCGERLDEKFAPIMNVLTDLFSDPEFEIPDA